MPPLAQGLQGIHSVLERIVAPQHVKTAWVWNYVFLKTTLLVGYVEIWFDGSRGRCQIYAVATYVQGFRIFVAGGGRGPPYQIIAGTTT
jgi:hypothetical protein